jgi:hypothetical protein
MDMTVNRLILDVTSVTTTVVSKHLWETSPLPVTKQQISSSVVPRRNTLSHYGELYKTIHNCKGNMGGL